MSDTSRRLADDGFHEIQLTGKQVVFLFMAATVVSVVIFLCGVLVGRGVQAQRAAGADAPPGLTTSAEPSAAPPAAGADLDAAAGEPSETAAAVEKDISYPERLAGGSPPQETVTPKPAPAEEANPVESAVTAGQVPVRPPAPKPAPAEEAKPVESAKPGQAPARPAPPKPAPAEAAAPAAGSQSPGWVVQVTALSDRNAALALVKRLTDKGYPAFVVDPTPNDAAKLHRVRVGPYADRAEADGVLRRLEREEKFKPLITR